MDIQRAGLQPSAKGPLDWFTGTVRIDPLFQAPDPTFVQGASITFEPGEKHWHGATSTAMTHIAIQEKKNGKGVDWMEPVSDEQYHAANDITPQKRGPCDEQ